MKMNKTKKYFITLIILILGNYALFSQNIIVDSLILELSNAKLDTSKINILNQLSLKIVATDVETAYNYGNTAIEMSKSASYNEGLALAYKNMGVIYFYKGNLENSIKNFNLSAETYNKIGDIEGEARAYNNLGVIFKNKGLYDSALVYYSKSTTLFLTTEDKSGLAMSYLNTAAVYQYQGNFQAALNDYFDALEIQEELKDDEQIANLRNNIALVYMTQENYEEAVENFKIAHEIFVKIDDKKGIADYYNNMGIIFYEKGESENTYYDTAIVYYEKSLEIFTEIGLKSKIALLNYNLGDANNKLKNNEEAKNYLDLSLQLYVELEDNKGISLAYSGLGENYFNREDYINAVVELEKALTIATEVGAIKNIKDITEFLSQSYAKLGKFKEAYETHVIFKLMNDSIFSEENEREITQLSMQYEFDKKEKEQQIIHEAEIKQQKLINIFTFFGLALVILLAFFVYRSYRIKSIANIELRLKNEEIMQQKEEIQAQRDEIEMQKDEIENQRDVAVHQKEEIQFQKKEIEDSIHYAKRIQNAVLPAKDILSGTFISSHFIFFKPRDIVSGDFYWATQKGEELVVAVADCTGHGVPGAFMSMLGVAFLNEIVNRDEKLAANEILNHLREHVIASLHQTGKEMESKDGMDISLCIFNNSKHVVQYSGAYNPLYLIRKKDIKLPDIQSEVYVIFENEQCNYHLFEIKSDRMPIGIHVKNAKDFTNHEFPFLKNDVIYLFSDGFPDQFGGKDDRKFTYKQFKNMFLCMQNLEMENQKEKLLTELQNWMGKRKQLDDITILGIKI